MALSEPQKGWVIVDLLRSGVLGGDLVQIYWAGSQGQHLERVREAGLGGGKR